MLAETRRAAILEMLRINGSVSVNEIQEALEVSTMTVRRDLSELAARGIVVRTHGGAVMPTISGHEDSFATRVEEATEAKTALADAAVEMLSPRDAVFLDSSSTSFFVAQQAAELNLELTIITNSLPIAAVIVRQQAPIELISVGGTLRALTQSFVGPHALRTLQSHFADYAFISVKALSPTGILTDADPLEAEVKRMMLSQARESVLLMDRSKLSARGLNAIGRVARMSSVLVHGLRESELNSVRDFGAPVRSVGASASPVCH